jgi:cell shape-determining protein MreC
MPIPSEITKAFAKVARENFKLRAELRAMWSVLETLRTLGQPPTQWQELLRRARETAVYRNDLELYSQQLSKLESLADENEVLEILQKYPSSDLVN